MYHLRTISRPAFDNVKMSVEVEEDRERFYFARCVAFMKDADGDVFVALRWYTEVQGTVVDPVVRLAPLTLAHEGLPSSYSIMPAHAILNGALIVPHKDQFWALQSPREQEQYLLQNSM